MKCSFPNCIFNAEPNGFCIRHKDYGTVVKKKVYQIPKKSKKAIKEAPGYRAFVSAYLSRPENKRCRIDSPVCTKKATTINHKKRRYPDTKMNEKFIEPSCYKCNIYIEQHDAWARERGHLLSKF